MELLGGERIEHCVVPSCELLPVSLFASHSCGDRPCGAVAMQSTGQALALYIAHGATDSEGFFRGPGRWGGMGATWRLLPRSRRQFSSVHCGLPCGPRTSVLFFSGFPREAGNLDIFKKSEY